jgi:hypothetical protein
MSKRKQDKTTLGGFMRFAAFSAATLLVLASTDSVAEWIDCAREDGFCKFDGRREVAYGAGKKWVTKVFTGGVACTNRKFGDPAPGMAKTCKVSVAKGEDPAPEITSSWVKCAGEGAFCKFSGAHKVAFGAGRKFNYRTFRDGAKCASVNFGDPAPGVVKACFYNPK